MKGGTATKILLEVIFSLAHLLLRDHVITPAVTMYGCYANMKINVIIFSSYRNLIQCYELAWRQVCLLKEDISKAVQLAGERCGSVITMGMA